MTTAITLFEQPQTMPAYLQNDPVARVLGEQMEGGLAGRQINRVSLRNGKFRFNKNGVEVIVSQKPTLDVVIIAANPAVSRLYYAKAFDAEAVGERPDCYSRDGKAPEADSPNKQSEVCATCKQNAVGSAINGKGRACAFKKRVVIVAPSKIEGDAFAVDVAAMGLFGDDKPAQRQYNLRSYIEALKANGLIVPAVVTRLSFDDDESVPKLFFTPVRVLDEGEFTKVKARLNDPEVRGMLDDIDNKPEVGKPIGQITAPTGVQPTTLAPAPAQAAPAAVANPAPATQVPPQPVQRRGRPAKSETAPAAAPAAPAATAPEGFGIEDASAAAPAPGAAPAAAGGFSIDLDDFDV